MAVTALFFAYRKPGTTAEEFKKHYEENHIPLIKSLAGDLFFARHTRKYAVQVMEDTGTSDESQWDCMAELEWRDQAHFEEFVAWTLTEPVKGKIAEDEERFLDTTKRRIVVLGDVITTTK